MHDAATTHEESLRALVGRANEEQGWSLSSNAVSRIIDGLAPHVAPTEWEDEQTLLRMIGNYYLDSATIDCFLFASPPPPCAKVGREWTEYLVRVVRGKFRLPEEQAQDLAQEAWIDLLQGLPRFNYRSRLTSWAYRVLTNRVLQWIRRRQLDIVFFEALFQEEGWNWEDCVPDPRDSPDRAATTATHFEQMKTIVVEEIERVARTMRDTDISRETKARIARLSIIEGGRAGEIAEELGLDPRAVSTILHRIRVKLIESPQIAVLFDPDRGAE